MAPKTTKDTDSQLKEDQKSQVSQESSLIAFINNNQSIYQSFFQDNGNQSSFVFNQEDSAFNPIPKQISDAKPCTISKVIFSSPKTTDTYFSICKKKQEKHKETRMKKIQKKKEHRNNTNKEEREAEKTITVINKRRVSDCFLMKVFESEPEEIDSYLPVSHIHKPENLILYKMKRTVDTCFLGTRKLKTVNLRQYILRRDEEDTQLNCFQCKSCEKIFSTRAALGGHTSKRHCKTKNNHIRMESSKASI